MQQQLPPMPYGFKILGTGGYLPQTVLTSAQIDHRFGWPQGKTEARYGLKQRHVASQTETSSLMAARAATQALQRAGLVAEDLDLILGACGVMEQSIPSTAVLVQDHLGLSRSGIAAYDVNATCLSFIQALDLASLKIAAGQARYVLVFSADIASVGLDWSRPDTAAIFGDGAAAVVVGPGPQSILAHRFNTYAAAKDACVLAGGGTRHQWVDAEEARYFRMDGKQAFRTASQYLPDFLEELLKDAGLDWAQIDWIIPHQASGLSLSHGMARLGLPAEKVVNIFATQGNQIATSIPSTLNEAVEKGQLQHGQVAVLIGTSAGISLGGMVLRY